MSTDDQVMDPVETERRFLTEDWWSVVLAAVLITLSILGVVTSVIKPSAWTTNPVDAFTGGSLLGVVAMFVGFAVLTGTAAYFMGEAPGRYLAGFAGVAVLTTIARVVGTQATLKEYGLGYALWALAIGLLIANTVGAHEWLLAGAKSELFIKIGLVLLGAEILFPRMVELGIPGVMVAWIVTPVVILFMWQVSRRWIRVDSPALAITVATATSVCGVSAAIAAASASKAKKEELTLVVSMTMVITVAMMVGMPALANLIGLDQFVGGAWIGGTVDSTGAVVASGSLLGPDAEQVAAVVKMIQNMLIGIVAFLIAVYWVTKVEPGNGDRRPGVTEIWRRFPKFVVGFIGASLFFSFILLPLLGEDRVLEVTSVTKGWRGWWFALAFMSIGLTSNFRELAKEMGGGKPLALYAVGQTFNIVLTLLVAWLAFGVLFQQ